MRRYEIILAQEAEKDLRGAVNYIAKNLCEPAAAENLLNCFEETVRSVYKELHADRETGC